MQLMMFIGGGAGRISGEMFELLTFSCRKIIKSAIHMTCLKNESIYIQKTGCCVMLALFIYRYSRTSNAFVSVPFS